MTTDRAAIIRSVLDRCLDEGDITNGAGRAWWLDHVSQEIDKALDPNQLDAPGLIRQLEAEGYDKAAILAEVDILLDPGRDHLTNQEAARIREALQEGWTEDDVDPVENELNRPPANSRATHGT